MGLAWCFRVVATILAAGQGISTAVDAESVVGAAVAAAECEASDSEHCSPPSDADDLEDAMAFLQMNSGVHNRALVADSVKLDLSRRALALQSAKGLEQLPKECGRLLSEDCEGGNAARCHSKEADFFRPANQVLSEHPGVDGLCYFNDGAQFLQHRAGTDYVARAVATAAHLRVLSDQRAEGFPRFSGDGRGPEVTYQWEGEKVVTNLDSFHYVLDDLYGYSLGFLQGQRLGIRNTDDAATWEDLATQQCAKVQQQHQFRDEELILSDYLESNLPTLVRSACVAGVELPPAYKGAELLSRSGYRTLQSCEPVTPRELAHRFYMKCVLGKRSAAADLAYLSSRACLLSEHHIGHLSQCTA